MSLATKTVHSLNFSSFVYGMPLADSIQPSSGRSLAIAPYILSGSPTEPPEITISYPGSDVTSFDMQSITHACALATQQGIVMPATKCTILYTGTKVSGDKVTLEATFEPDGFVDVGSISLFEVKMKKVSFLHAHFDGLTRLTFKVTKPEAGGLV